MIICNISAIPQMVQIDTADGKTTEIRVMPKARPMLPPGAVVNARWLAVNPRIIHIFEEQPVKQEIKLPPANEDAEEE